MNRNNLMNQDKHHIHMKKYYIIFAFMLAGFFSFASTRLYIPTLVAPVDAASGQMPDVLLDWNPVSGTIGLHYEIQVDTAASFTNPILLQTDLSSIHASELLFGTKYFWRVRAVDNNGTSEWSVVRSFNVVITVSLYKPNNSAIDQMPNAEISWSPTVNPQSAKAFTGVSHLDYQLDTVATFDSPLALIITAISGTLSKTNLNKLHFGEKYFWRMRARNANDTSIWSESRSFTTLSTVTLKTPSNNASNQNPLVTFSWNKITGVDKYILQVSDNADFNLPMAIETTKISIDADTLKFGMTYYWKVRALHASDGVNSPVRMFSTLNTVVLSVPANNQTGVDLAPNFKWKTIAGSEHYEMWLSSSSEFTNPKKYGVASTSTGSEQAYRLPANILDSAGVYFWKVRAFVTGDTTNWSDTWSFRVATSGIEDDPITKNGISLYPNPANNKVSLTVQSSGPAVLQLAISDLLGKAVIASKVQLSNGKSTTDIDVSSLPAGIYFVRLQRESLVYSTKLIINR
jgi:hypothetical protein